MEELKYKYPDLSKRMFASVIDFLIVITVGTIIGYIVLTLVSLFKMIDANSFEAISITMVTYPISFWLYYSILESSRYMGTIGKKFLGIIVVDCSFQRISFFKASIRFVCKIVSITSVVGILIIFFNKKRRCLHDILANCIVVSK